jgi:hypothetical protein
MALQPISGFGLRFMRLRNLTLYRRLVGLLGRVISPPQGRYLHRTTQAQNERSQTSMLLARIEPTIPLFKRAKTFHASTVTGEPSDTISKCRTDNTKVLGWLQSTRRYNSEDSTHHGDSTSLSISWWMIA